MFAKLFGEGDRQIAVILKESNEGPEVRLFFKPDGLGVCETGLGYPYKAFKNDESAAWKAAESCFAKMDEEHARAIADKVAAKFAELSGS